LHSREDRPSLRHRCFGEADGSGLKTAACGRARPCWSV
jgi:hypothetical protein